MVIYRTGFGIRDKRKSSKFVYYEQYLEVGPLL